jgi:hypothetical protein
MRQLLLILGLLALAIGLLWIGQGLGARPDRRCDGHLLQVSRLRRRLRG